MLGEYTIRLGRDIWRVDALAPLSVGVVKFTVTIIIDVERVLDTNCWTGKTTKICGGCWVTV